MYWYWLANHVVLFYWKVYTQNSKYFMRKVCTKLYFERNAVRLVVYCLIHIYMKSDLNVTVIMWSSFVVIYVEPDSGECSGWCVYLAGSLCIPPTPAAGDVKKSWTLIGYSSPLHPSQGGALSELARASQMGHVCGEYDMWCRQPTHDVPWEAKASASTLRCHPADSPVSTDVHQCCRRSCTATDFLSSISSGQLSYMFIISKLCFREIPVMLCIYCEWS